MSRRVLFVDDEPSILRSMERIFIDSGYELLFAEGAEAALRVVKESPVDLIVSDNRMPGMTGIEFFGRVRNLSPETVKVLMTGYADLDTALESINSGEVFRFLLKPWDNDDLVKVVADGLARQELLQSLRRQDEAVLMSLAQTIELKDRYTRGHCDRVAQYALMIAEGLGFSYDRLREIRHGSWLHDCGKIGVPEAILNFDGRLSDEQMNQVRNHPTWGAGVARQANLPPTVVNIIESHHEFWDGKGYPSGKKGEEIPIEARIVAVADVYDAITTDRPYRTAMAAEKVEEVMRRMAGKKLDPALTDLFFRLKGEAAG